jgi:hypothetical protein
MTEHMTEDERLRRALDYEIEPWMPDPDELIRGGRRIAWIRRAAAATAAVAVAGTVTGVALAVNGVNLSQPPVSDTPRPVPSTVRPTPLDNCVPTVLATKPTHPLTVPRRVVTATPPPPRTKMIVPSKPAKGRTKPIRCVVLVPTIPPGASKAGPATIPPQAGMRLCLQIHRPQPSAERPLERCATILRSAPTTPVPTSVPAGR